MMAVPRKLSVGNHRLAQVQKRPVVRGAEPALGRRRHLRQAEAHPAVFCSAAAASRIRSAGDGLTEAVGRCGLGARLAVSQ